MSESFTRTIAGRDVEFRPAKPAQMTAYRRVRERLSKDFEALRQLDPTDETLLAMSELYDRFEENELDLVTSLLANPDDQDFIDRSMVRGETSLADIVGALFGGEPEEPDDAEPAVKPQAAKKKAAARVPKGARVSNGKRTQR